MLISRLQPNFQESFRTLCVYQCFAGYVPVATPLLRLHAYRVCQTNEHKLFKTAQTAEISAFLAKKKV